MRTRNVESPNLKNVESPNLKNVGNSNIKNVKNIKNPNIKNLFIIFIRNIWSLNTSYGIINCNEKLAFDSKKRAPQYRNGWA